MSDRRLRCLKIYGQITGAFPCIANSRWLQVQLIHSIYIITETTFDLKCKTPEFVKDIIQITWLRKCPDIINLWINVIHHAGSFSENTGRRFLLGWDESLWLERRVHHCFLRDFRFYYDLVVLGAPLRHLQTFSGTDPRVLYDSRMSFWRGCCMIYILIVRKPLTGSWRRSLVWGRDYGRKLKRQSSFVDV
jgi:hypothetical protein